MPYHLLTGATGLLGTYLLRDLPQAGIPLAVVARGAAHESSRQRIENIVSRWERLAGHALPRPIVLEGDITRPHLGLSPADLEWIAEHCEAVIHNAASLTFTRDEKSGEPWTSNVIGTRHLLDLCQRLGIGRLHHVSTAYVCGLREGVILERELDVGQSPANEYERSKLESEKMVRAADHIASTTVFRPAIIVGDSRTGHTSTYHGFYAPLRVFHGFARAELPTELTVASILGFLGLTGREHKNFVPVDWVSAAITQIVASPELHGRTYHLTPPQRVPLADMGSVMAQCLVEYRKQLAGGQSSQADIPQLARAFQEQMRIYQSYWRDDPEFDAANTREALSHLPCPIVDRVMMMRLCKYAIDHNFGWPRPGPSIPAVDWVDRLAAVQFDEPPAGNGSTTHFLALHVNGPGGGQWKIELRGDELSGLERGIPADPKATLYLNAHTLRRIAAGDLPAAAAIRTGKLLVEGEDLIARDIVRLLDGMAARLGGADETAPAAAKECPTS